MENDGSHGPFSPIIYDDLLRMMFHFANRSKFPKGNFIELDYGKIYRKTLYLMVKTMVSCRFSLKPIQ